ncbi:lytic transglycosylase domain-containing protein [Desulfuribacillus alkaliarsenatis]|uniref:Transglycosylase SLT domain-containing protein n=1 Tax=Desulfuribacillus alkaliarsenatis TaxID=766136 RepID=A0A1E5FYG0_9FIRM|nr:lytic transglycosylase domain-containing protein [Desulfuribacillus alkaliarsenatis]OEF95600.1 hypothetical protein BHF68_12180 [Desulfuribacillus alkaliarsenatis]
MNFIKQKRWWLLLLAIVLIVLNTNFFWKLVYPIPYKDIIWEQAELLEQDPRLVAAVIMVESKYRKDSVSKKGALGLMQVMPNTAMWAAEINGIEYTYIEELAEPHTNIYLGTWYLKFLNHKYENKLPLVLAGYNSGPTRVDEWLQYGVWDGESIEQIPFGETRHYIQRVTHFYERYKKIY